MAPLRVGVVGAGGWGRNHLRVFASLPDVELVGFVEPDAARARDAAEHSGARPYETLGAILAEGVEALTVAVPTPGHLEVVLAAVAGGCHVLVEKPIASRLDEAEAMIRAAREAGVLLAVGHVERWNPAYEAIRERSAGPLFVEAHRLATFNPRGTEVAVVLDLMIHDIDLVLDLVGKPVERVEAVGVAVLSREIDIANARLAFRGGTIANLTASRISRDRMRKLRLFEGDRYLAADLVTRTAECYRKIAAPSGEGAVRIVADPIEVPPEEPLTRELRDFARAVQGGAPLRVPGEAGRDALDVAIRIIDAIAAHAAAAGGAEEARRR